MRQGKNGRGPLTAVRSDTREGRRVVPAIVFHGDQDSTVHPCNGDEVIAQSTPAMPLDTRVEEGRVIGGHSYTRLLHADTGGGTLLEQWLIPCARHGLSRR